MLDKEVDTTNMMAVGMQGDQVVLPFIGRKLSRDTALNMAAWIVAMCDRGEFEPLLDAIRRT